jgi:hypothetical protein
MLKMRSAYLKLLSTISLSLILCFCSGANSPDRLAVELPYEDNTILDKASLIRLLEDDPAAFYLRIQSDATRDVKQRELISEIARGPLPADSRDEILGEIYFWTGVGSDGHAVERYQKDSPEQLFKSYVQYIESRTNKSEDVDDMEREFWCYPLPSSTGYALWANAKLVRDPALRKIVLLPRMKAAALALSGKGEKGFALKKCKYRWIYDDLRDARLMEVDGVPFLILARDLTGAWRFIPESTSLWSDSKLSYQVAESVAFADPEFFIKKIDSRTPDVDYLQVLARSGSPVAMKIMKAVSANAELPYARIVAERFISLETNGARATFVCDRSTVRSTIREFMSHKIVLDEKCREFSEFLPSLWMGTMGGLDTVDKRGRAEKAIESVKSDIARVESKLDSGSVILRRTVRSARAVVVVLLDGRPQFTMNKDPWGMWYFTYGEGLD